VVGLCVFIAVNPVSDFVDRCIWPADRKDATDLLFFVRFFGGTGGGTSSFGDSPLINGAYTAVGGLLGGRKSYIE
jgi:hypothetical protein